MLQYAAFSLKSASYTHTMFDFTAQRQFLLPVPMGRARTSEKIQEWKLISANIHILWGKGHS